MPPTSAAVTTRCTSRSRGSELTRVLITAVERNPPGLDVAAGAGEYVLLRNVSDSPAEVSGWRIEDAAGHNLVLEGPRVIPPRGDLRIFTAPGPSSAVSEFEQRRRAVINNAPGETLRLRDAAGQTVQIFPC
jgi:hypothetical protein